LSKRCSKSCPKSFAAIALPGPPENVSLWPLLRSTAKLTLSSPSAVSRYPRSACSSCSLQPLKQDRRGLVREELAPRAARSRPRRCSLQPRAPPRRPPSPVTFQSRLRVHELLQVIMCLACSLTSTSTTPPLTSPESASDPCAPKQAATHGELLSATTTKSVSPLHQCPPQSVPASLHRRLAGDWPPPPPCAMPRHLPCFNCWAGHGPRDRTVMGHARRDSGPHTSAAGPRGSCASGPPPGIRPTGLFLFFFPISD
jgi:hypothetical protein